MKRVSSRGLVFSIAVLLTALSGINWVSAEKAEPTIKTAMPKHWLPRTKMHCKSVKGVKHKMCDGPRRAPEPYGSAAVAADRLGLGSLNEARKLLHQSPPDAWVRAVKGNANKTLLWPVEDGSFGRGFGYVRKELKDKRHNGVDVGAPVGDLVRAMNDGIVVYSDNQITGFGNSVVLVHKDGSASFYCHQRANYVFPGQQVRRGQVVGEVGVTGISRGPHLHFEWHNGSDARDPMPRMTGMPTHKKHKLVDGDDPLML